MRQPWKMIWRLSEAGWLPALRRFAPWVLGRALGSKGKRVA